MKKFGFIAIVGRPNAGKSTLFNTLLKTKLAIVTPKAQSTRETLWGIYTQPQGQMILVDTPGIHQAKPHGLNAAMVHEVKEALKSPHLLWYLIDPFSELKHEQKVFEFLKTIRCPIALVFNKIDLVNQNKNRFMDFFQQIKSSLNDFKIPIKFEIFASAQEEKTLKALINWSWDHLPLGECLFFDEDQLSNRPLRFFVAEKIREQLFLQLDEEIPYSCYVEILDFIESNDLIRIHAMIHVERESQKKIIIGKKATKIKNIGIEARKEIESFLGQKIFLGTQVKVSGQWTKDLSFLRKIGYNISLI